VIWLGWRQQRTETAIAAGILALLVALLVPTGIEMAHAYARDGLASCSGPDHSFSCGNAFQTFNSRFEGLTNLVAWFTLVPGLVGALLAAPLVLDLEGGTYRLAWTQSMTRRRWILTRIGLAVAGALLVSAAIVALMTWWHEPLARLDGRMESQVYDFEGTVVAGYTLFALGLGLALGVLWRRAVPSLAVAFGSYFAARVFVDTWLRRRFLAPLTATWKQSAQGPDLGHAWVLGQYPSDRAGHAVATVVGNCVRSVGPHAEQTSRDCLAAHGAAYMHAVYLPASSFWTLQGIETALFGVPGLALVLFAARWLHRRLV
jgi:hypothetical protein